MVVNIWLTHRMVVQFQTDALIAGRLSHVQLQHPAGDSYPPLAQCCSAEMAGRWSQQSACRAFSIQ